MGNSDAACDVGGLTYFRTSALIVQFSSSRFSSDFPCVLRHPLDPNSRSFDISSHFLQTPFVFCGNLWPVKMRPNFIDKFRFRFFFISL
ncbi:unnamed protein product [Protopolystoma xenopodis]|uniref:Uncharacterized protein n=1 Tax=Protopolystoma xenopodis TaxID=117903 RepID=A0A3S5A299_9PLAT|nr:unnamed protein product [Protopolystoma xenopodis]